MKPKCYFLSSTNPYQNLATEDYFFRGVAAGVSYLLFYVNSPCVVMGRFQNPWTEIDLSTLDSNDILLVRRQSGGGTVYQDFQNLNWSFITEKSAFNLDSNNQAIIDALAEFNIKATVGERHGLYVEGKKISGVAFKEIKNAKYHHGTLLINSNLEKLNKILVQNNKIESKSIKSVRSEVINLKELNNEIEMRSLAETISKKWCQSCDDIVQYDNSQMTCDNFSKSEWVWGETPHFKIEFMGDYLGEVFKLYVSILKGRVIDVLCEALAIHPERVSEIREDIFNFNYSDITQLIKDPYYPLKR